MEAAALAKAIVMLFVILDPVTVAPFYAVEASRIKSERARVEFLNKVLLSALAMLIAFAVVGDYLFNLLNVNFDDFRVAAGIILMIYAVASLFDIHIGGTVGTGRGAIVPLAVPLLAGPGSISTLLYIKYSYGYTVALASAVINIALAYPIFYYSSYIVRILGDYGISLVDKFMSLIMAGFSVSIIRDGIEGMIRGLD